jgi:hypothetical protein
VFSVQLRLRLADGSLRNLLGQFPPAGRRGLPPQIAIVQTAGVGPVLAAAR